MVSSWSAKGSLRHRFNHWLFRHVDFVTSVGDKALQDLIDLYEFPSASAAVIRRGIPEEQYDKTLQRQLLLDKFGFASDARILMHVGQFSAEKNHPFLIESFVRIKARYPSAKLILIGEGVNYRRIVDEVSGKGLAHDIVFAGYQNNVQGWLAGADMFVLTSTIEGVPGVVLEAGMQEVPSVAVKVGGVGEVIQNGITGLLVEQHDADQFAEAVLYFLQHEDKRIACGKAAAKLVKTSFSVSSCASAFEKIYSQMQQQPTK